MNIKEDKKMLDTLKKIAMDLGALDARVISTKDVVVENRVVLKCKYWCDRYGMNWSCPPYVPSVEEFRSILKEYNYALIVKFQSSAKVSTEALKLITAREVLGMQKGMKELESFYKIWNEDKRKAHLALLELEKFAFANGYPFALALIPGSCNLCPKCDVTKPCVHPEMLRFSVESVGVNITKTLQPYGIDLKIPINKASDNVNIIGMLLIT